MIYMMYVSLPFHSTPFTYYIHIIHTYILRGLTLLTLQIQVLCDFLHSSPLPLTASFAPFIHLQGGWGGGEFPPGCEGGGRWEPPPGSQPEFR